MVNVVKSAFTKLRKKFNKGYEHYLSIYLVINVIWIFLGMFLCSYTNFSYKDVSTSYVLLFVFNVIVTFFLIILRKNRFDKIDYFLILLTIFGIISTIYSRNSMVSLYGFYRRYEGLIQLLYYYSLMYLSSFIIADRFKKNILLFIITFGLINSFISFLQIFDILKFIPINNRHTSLAQGLTNNSNFLGSYMVLCLGLSIGIFLYSKKNSIIKSLINLILCCCFFSGLLMSNALSGMVGLFFISVFFVLYFAYLLKNRMINRKVIIRYVVLIISILSINYLFNSSNNVVMNNDLMRLTAETKEVFKGNFDDSYGSFRLYIWKNTFEIVPKNLIHGVGIDCFFYAFGYEPLMLDLNSKQTVYFDKVHNEYLQKLICEGAFSCITYIGMLFYVFLCSIRSIFKKHNYITIALFLSFIGYSIQAFFNISVIEVSPLFFIVIGLLYDRNCKDLQN